MHAIPLTLHDERREREGAALLADACSRAQKSATFANACNFVHSLASPSFRIPTLESVCFIDPRANIAKEERGERRMKVRVCERASE